jgi:hypothetical protein
VKFDAAGNLQMTARDWFGVLTGLLGSVVGVLMKDAGTTQAQTPDAGVKQVDSHETPDDPNDVPVVK